MGFSTHMETHMAAKKLFFPHLKLMTGCKEGHHPKTYHMLWKVVSINEHKRHKI